MLTAALVASLLAAAGAPSDSPPPPDHRPDLSSIPPPPAADADAPPAGSAADKALWTRARQANTQVTRSRAVASRLQLRAKNAEYKKRLEARAAAGPDAEKAEVLLASLTQAWDENVKLLLQPWPVDPTRACQYDLLYFESGMLETSAGKGAKTKEAKYHLEEAREALVACLKRAELGVGRMASSNKALEAVMAEAQALVGAAQAPPGAAAAAQPRSPPAPAAPPATDEARVKEAPAKGATP